MDVEEAYARGGQLRDLVVRGAITSWSGIADIRFVVAASTGRCQANPPEQNAKEEKVQRRKEK